MKTPDETENYLQIIETEAYWDIQKVIFVTILISIIFISIFCVVMAITPIIISYFLLETVTPGQIMGHFSPRLSKVAKAIKKLVHKHGPWDKKVDDDDKESVEDAIGRIEEARPTIVDELEWRGLKNRAMVYRARGSKLSPSESLIDFGVRYFVLQEE